MKIVNIFDAEMVARYLTSKKAERQIIAIIRKARGKK